MLVTRNQPSVAVITPSTAAVPCSPTGMRFVSSSVNLRAVAASNVATYAAGFSAYSAGTAASPLAASAALYTASFHAATVFTSTDVAFGAVPWTLSNVANLYPVYV